MIEVINLIRCTCDVCKRSFDVKKTEENPLKRLILPIKYYTETGSFSRVTTDNVDVCKDCLVQMETDLSEHYEMSSVAYGGVSIKRKGGEDNA